MASSLPDVDLLYFRDTLAADPRPLRQAATFAFATSDSSGAIARALVAELPEPTTWVASDFEKDLFLDELITSCFPVLLGGKSAPAKRDYLRRVLSHPPAEASVVEKRQALLHELAKDAELEQRLSSVCVKFRCLESLLCSAPIGHRADVIRRRLDVLSAVVDVVTELGRAAPGARSELRRVTEFASAVEALPGYRRLVDLLEYDNDMAKLDVQLRLGSDGRLRRLELVAVHENRRNTFYASPLRRFARKVVLFLRGYGFSENEVLGHLVESVYQGVEAVLLALLRLHAQLEVYAAALGFRAKSRSEGLDVCLPHFRLPGDQGPRVSGLFNPLLLSHRRPIPCDLDVRRSDASVIVTGPNSGGKTRLLQAFALCQLLGQGGFFVPARQATLLLAPTLQVSLFEQPTADHREGRLGTELLRIRRLFENVRPGSLVILDELCSGTNPTEGQQIFQLVLALLAEVKPLAFITTHYLRFAAELERSGEPDNVEFLQAELDEQQVPTYAFTPGVARSSLASQTASRLGVTREELHALVKAAAAKQRALDEASPPRVPAHPEGPGLRDVSARSEPKKAV